MTRISEQTLLAIWAAGERQHPLDRALTALAASSQLSRGELADLAIGERDARLFALYRALAGSRLAALCRCPVCGEPVELELPIDGLCAPLTDSSAGEATVEHHGIVVRCRQPSSRDLAAVAQAGSVAEARALLLAASVVSASACGEPLAAAELGQALVERIEQCLAEMTPPAEILLALSCPSCNHDWPAPFDIGEAVWSRIELAARALMEQVVDLGRAYGWSEAEVLALPSARRRFYQEHA